MVVTDKLHMGKMLKKAIIVLVFLGLFFRQGAAFSVAGPKAVLTLFYSKTCPHCIKEEAFLEKLQDRYPSLEIKAYEVSESTKNQRLFHQEAERLGIERLGVPLTIIGDQHFLGYLDDATTGKAIEQAVIDEFNLATPEEKEASGKAKIPDRINVPVFGSLRLADLSLPVLTVVIAALDGFNPCAMWTLLFLISLLLGLKDRKRMWVLGTAFIVASGLVYFLFLAAWLNLFLFLGWVWFVRIAVGLLAVGAGGYYLYDFYKNKDSGCQVTGGGKRKAVFEKLREIVGKRSFMLALTGIVLLAVAVNMIELICSAGLPAIYTHLLTLAGLPVWQYYFYLVLYIVIFMLDDLFVFFAAMLTLQMTGIQGKYSRYSHLLGGILILVIGILMLFKPEWLMFN